MLEDVQACENIDTVIREGKLQRGTSDDLESSAGSGELAGMGVGLDPNDTADGSKSHQALKREPGPAADVNRVKP
jgi:hypothetical protein